MDYLTENWLEILGTLVGVLYLYWEYRASMKVWVAGIIMPALSLGVYWKAALYADFGINVYYLVAAVYGYMVWRFGGDKKKQALPITSTPGRAWLPLGLAFLAAFLLMGYVLENFTDSTVPWWDSFTTALSIVGMFMLARKWVEQWLVWILVDVVSAGLYVFKDIHFYAALYAVYAVVAVFGYFEWKRQIQGQNHTPQFSAS